ncbi:MAG TPA: alpha/beta hydrolase [Sphingomicrobium sp.]|nr:alpha/beta hydrolase [Sphingomicrobium sp.]
MPKLIEIRPGIDLSYEDDYFGPPWETGIPILLVHGVAESSRAWTQWVPHLAAAFRVIRPDLPGFGSSPVPTNYSWTTAEMAADLVHLLDRLDIGRFHLVGAKYGGSTALQLAADFPDRVRSLVVLGTPARGSGTGLRAELGSVPEMVRQFGVRGWAERTQVSRLGSGAPPEQLRWWTDELMGKADPRACIGCSSSVATMDLEHRMRDITAPSLVVTTADSPLQPVETARAYQQAIPNSRLMVLPGDCYHVAAVQPQECAGIVRDFIRSLG